MTNSYGLQLSDNAAKRISKLLPSEAPGSRLRIIVESGGCNGFQYKFDFDNRLNDDDIIIKNGEVEAVFDETSASLMEGSVVDYIESLGFAHFEIKNPQSTSSCGCGNSFGM